MREAPSVIIGAGKAPARLIARFANRHGLIAGATGTGKTLTLQSLAEGFSDIGVPCFVVDAKGDLSGVAAAGELKPAFVERLTAMGLPADDQRACPALFWDVFGDKGHPVKVPVSAVGPLLLGRLLGLNEVQEGVLNVAFRVADDDGLLLLDLKDLRAVLAHIAERAAELSAEYGNVSKASVGAVQRALLVLEQEGADKFLGEPELNLDDLMQADEHGKGVISVLAADVLIHRPRLYGTLLVWLLSELYENLPEVGDRDRPRLVLFFDEAHLLFDGAAPALVDKIEQVVRLIRSKGVGVYFVTQNPLDVPEEVLGQLGNRVQHALRAFTPRDQRAVAAAADTFRPNPKLDTGEAIKNLAVGEALVSFLDETGAPTVVERVKIRPPRSRVGPLSAEERRKLIEGSPLFGHYEKEVDRESAYELLRGNYAADRTEDSPPSRGGAQDLPPPPPAPTPWGRRREEPVYEEAVYEDAPVEATGGYRRASRRADEGGGERYDPTRHEPERAAPPARREPPRGGSDRGRERAAEPASIGEEIAYGVMKELGGHLGRRVVRGILGAILKR
jgi:uncharacterized protein